MSLLQHEVVRQAAFVAGSLLLGAATLALLDQLMLPRNIVHRASLSAADATLEVGRLNDGDRSTEVRLEPKQTLELTVKLDRKRMLQEFRAQGRGPLLVEVRGIDQRGKLKVLGKGQNRVVRWRSVPLEELKIRLSASTEGATVRELDLR